MLHSPGSVVRAITVVQEASKGKMWDTSPAKRQGWKQGREGQVAADASSSVPQGRQVCVQVLPAVALVCTSHPTAGLCSTTRDRDLRERQRWLRALAGQPKGSPACPLSSGSLHQAFPLLPLKLSCRESLRNIQHHLLCNLVENIWFCSPTVASRHSAVTLGVEGMRLGKNFLQHSRWGKSPSRSWVRGVSCALVSKNKSNKTPYGVARTCQLV